MTSTVPQTALSVRLREGTAEEHRGAETRTFMVRLMDGELDLATYGFYLSQYAHVYRALESREGRADDPAPLGDARLDRFPSIAADLDALGLSDWDSAEPLPATKAYVAHLHEIPADDVPRYLAHHYTRYLGDLSGGQAIGKLMARHYGATQEQLSFYRFEGIDRAPRYKEGYRAAIDAIGFDEAQAQALIDESKRAFALNAAIFDELGRVYPAV